MNKYRIRILILYFSIIFISFHNIYGQTIKYEISVKDTKLKLFSVKCEIQNINQDRIQLDWPVWTPGYVVLWNYGQHVSAFNAFDSDGNTLVSRRVSESRLYIECKGVRSLIFTYDLHAIDPPENLGFAQAYLDSVQGWYNGAAMFPEISGMRNLETKVDFQLPPGWDLATAMLPDGEDGYLVKSFDELVDNPVQIGKFLKREFEIRDVKFEFVVAGCDTVDMEKLESMLKTIVDEEFTLMQNVPIDRYLFIFHVSKRGAGGLEHLNSTTISLRKEEYFGEKTWLRVVVAHEFYHVWNAKRIRNKTFDLYDYSQKHRSPSVWFAEGITAYYTDLILHRSELFSKEEVYSSLANILDLYENNPARKRLSWEDISWYIWEPELRQGLEVWLLPGWMIDLKIRDITNNSYSLDDVMRFMDNWYGNNDIGFENKDLPRIINAVIKKDFFDFFQRHISGCEEFPYDELLSVAGLKWNKSIEVVPTLGCRFGKMVDGRVKVVNLDEYQKKGGLYINDIIVKVNHYEKPKFEELQNLIKNFKTGSEISLVVDRSGSLVQVLVTVLNKEVIKSSIEEIKNPSSRQLSIRNGILEGILP